MDLNLKNKVIIVTGGSKGIGLGITETLVKEGAIPVIISRNKASVEAVINKIHAEEKEAHYAIAELTDPEQCLDSRMLLVR